MLLKKKYMNSKVIPHIFVRYDDKQLMKESHKVYKKLRLKRTMTSESPSALELSSRVPEPLDLHICKKK